MRKLQGAIAAGALATAALAASPAGAAVRAGPDSIIGDKGRPVVLTAAAASCSYGEETWDWNPGPGGNVRVTFGQMNTCATWQVKILCQQASGTSVWRYSRLATGPASLIAGCLSSQNALSGGWVGDWNHRYHQVAG